MDEAREPGKPLDGLSNTPAGSEVNSPYGGTNLTKKNLDHSLSLSTIKDALMS
jgi:hypothetical protein